MHANDSVPVPADVATSPSFRNDPTVRKAAVRRAGRDDAALLADVAAATFALACPPGTTPAAIAAFIATNLTEQRFADYLADPARDLFIGLDNHHAVGYTMLVTTEPTDPDVAAVVTRRPAAELSKLYVRASQHGTGLAAELVEATVARAAERGAAVVWLGVNQLNVRANRFYEKEGFALVGTKRFLVGDKLEDDFVRAVEL